MHTQAKVLTREKIEKEVEFAKNFDPDDCDNPTYLNACIKVREDMLRNGLPDPTRARHLYTCAEFMSLADADKPFPRDYTKGFLGTVFASQEEMCAYIRLHKKFCSE